MPNPNESAPTFNLDRSRANLAKALADAVCRPDVTPEGAARVFESFLAQLEARCADLARVTIEEAGKMVVEERQARQRAEERLHQALRQADEVERRETDAYRRGFADGRIAGREEAESDLEVEVEVRVNGEPVHLAASEEIPAKRLH